MHEISVYLKKEGLNKYIEHDISIREIALKFKVSTEYVRQLLIKEEPNVQSLKLDYYDKLINRLYYLCTNGVSLNVIRNGDNSIYLNKIIKDTTLSDQSLKLKLIRIFRQYGFDDAFVLTSKQVSMQYVRINVFMLLTESALTQQEIANICGVSQSFVGNIKQNGFLLKSIPYKYKARIYRNYEIINGCDELDDILLNEMIKQSMDGDINEQYN